MHWTKINSRLTYLLDDLVNPEYENSLVIIATPPSVTNRILRSLEFLFNSSITITDTTSTKVFEKTRIINFPKNFIFSSCSAGSHLSGKKSQSLIFSMESQQSCLIM